MQPAPKSPTIRRCGRIPRHYLQAVSKPTELDWCMNFQGPLITCPNRGCWLVGRNATRLRQDGEHGELPARPATQVKLTSPDFSGSWSCGGEYSWSGCYALKLFGWSPSTVRRQVCYFGPSLSALPLTGLASPQGTGRITMTPLFLFLANLGQELQGGEMGDGTTGITIPFPSRRVPKYGYGVRMRQGVSQDRKHGSCRPESQARARIRLW